MVEVRDQGMGIGKKDQEQLFNPFYQAGKGGQGLGLGLYIVKELIERQSGKVWVKSVKGKGSSFFVSFPLVRVS